MYPIVHNSIVYNSQHVEANQVVHDQVIGLRRCYSTTKNAIRPFAAMWMDLENIMLSEISQRKIDIVCLHIGGIIKKPNDWMCRTETLSLFSDLYLCFQLHI